MRDDCLTDVVRQYVPAESVEEQWDLPALEKALASDWQVPLALQQEVEGSEAITDDEILQKVLDAARAAFDAKVAMVGGDNFTQFERMVLLQSFDTSWRDHLSSLDYLRQGIHLRGYAQKQPKQEYKREAFELFRQLIDQVKNEVTRVMMTVQVQSSAQVDEAAQALEQRGENIGNVTYSAPNESGGVDTTSNADGAAALNLPEGVRVGRNDPCPCGSGKKFKQCHGKLA
jgi:preprotein translocase subunit SecA